MDLMEIYKNFTTETDCHNYLIQLRWPNGIECVYCCSKQIYRRTNENRLKCRCCNKSFSVTAKTIFHSTKLPLSKWFFAVVQILAAKKGISSLQLSRTIHVNKNTAWYMQMRIRAAMKSDLLLRGIIEVDEDFYFGEVKIVSPANPNQDKTLVLKSHGVYSSKFGDQLEYKRIRMNELRKSGRLEADGEWIKPFVSMFKRAVIGQYHKLSERHRHKYLLEIDFKKNYHSTEAFDILLLKACAFCWEMSSMRKPSAQ